MLALADPFQLQCHRGTREGPIYLLVKKNGPLHMTESKDKGEYSWSCVFATGIQGINENMPDMAWRLEQELGRPVVDRTGIEGSFDFEALYPAQGSDQVDLAAVALAVVEDLWPQARTRGSVETIVIDRAEKPRPN